MRNLIALVLLLGLLLTSGAQAASYFRTNGVVVDPIQSVLGGNLAYAGANLDPLADLSGANLAGSTISEGQFGSAASVTGVNLTGHDMSGWDITGVDLTGATLTSADLFSANLTDAHLWGANLTGADLALTNIMDAYLFGANLIGSILTDVWYYNDATWTDAFYYTDNEPTWGSGMDAAWRTSVGILALAPTSSVPEPAAILLALLGLALLPRRRRR
jgi:MYXO-CTERM domain-containing protein